MDLHFENPDSGFFLRPDGHLSSPAINQELNSGSGPWAGVAPDGGVNDLERFTVLDPTRPSLIRATYGPFSTKQTVPARNVIPEFPDDDDEDIDDFPANGTSPLSVVPPPYAPHVHQLEVSAHLVVREVTRARPSIRVLIHGAGARGHHSPHVCVTVLVRKGADVLSASCTPTGAGETGGDATCLVGLNVPSRWWPPHTRVTVKLPRTTADVSYMVGTASGPQECCQRDATGYGSYLGGGGPRVTVQPETSVGTVSLTLDPGAYEEISTDTLVHVLVPRGPLHPGTTIHAPLYLHPPGNLPAIVLVIR